MCNFYVCSSEAHGPVHSIAGACFPVLNQVFTINLYSTITHKIVVLNITFFLSGGVRLSDKKGHVAEEFRKSRARCSCS